MFSTSSSQSAEARFSLEDRMASKGVKRTAAQGPVANGQGDDPGMDTKGARIALIPFAAGGDGSAADFSSAVFVAYPSFTSIKFSAVKHTKVDGTSSITHKISTGTVDSVGYNGIRDTVPQTDPVSGLPKKPIASSGLQVVIWSSKSPLLLAAHMHCNPIVVIPHTCTASRFNHQSSSRSTTSSTR